MVQLKGQRVVILGAGASGVSALRLAVSCGASATLLDSGNPVLPQGLSACTVCLGKEALSWKGKADWVIVSPGVPCDSPLCQLGYETGAPVISELAFGASFLNCPLLAITGTNGKTTTVEMLTHCLNHCGKKAIACGNIGLPVSEVVVSGMQPEVAVLEVSSFQLEHPGSLSPDASALLNVTPDHLNRHHSFENYLEAKLALVKGTRKEIVMNDELLQMEAVRHALSGRKAVPFSVRKRLVFGYGIQETSLVKWENGHARPLISLENLPFTGEHNWQNALASVALAETTGLLPEAAAQALTHFSTGQHRLQTVAVSSNQVEFIDDSKATNVDALLKALEALRGTHRDIALIAGGLDKGCTLEEAIPELRQTVKAVFLIGACRERLSSLWGKVVPSEICSSMEEAVQKANGALPKGGIVLLSPACASMDMFKDYAERGEVFAKAVRKICF